MSSLDDQTSDPLPADVEARACRVCGYPIWVVKASDQAARMRSQGGRLIDVLFLEPNHRPGGGVKLVAGLGVFDPQGDYAMHACPGRVVDCKYCGERVLRLHQPPGSKERLAVLDPTPDPGGHVVITNQGFALYDPQFEHPGRRHRWHRLHGRAAENPRPERVR